MSARTYGPRAARTPAPRTNRFAGTCSLCRNRVAEEAGVTFKAGDKWVVQHNAGACPPPAPPKVYAQPDLGYYVRKDGAAIKVVESKRVNPDGTRRHYGLVFTPHEGKRPSWDYVKGAGLSVADLVPMSAHDAALLGLAHGHCINCCAPLGGKTLSSLVAARIGYGETCAANNGWPFPRGAAAQRDFLNRHP
jgi:hypothetical protein